MGIYKTKAGQYYVSLCYKNQKAFKRLPLGASKADAKAAEIELAARHKKEVDAAVKMDKQRRGAPFAPSIAALLDWYEIKHLPTLRSPRTAEHALKILRSYEELRDEKGIWWPKAADAPAIAEKIRADYKHLKPASLNRIIGILKHSLSHHFRIGQLDIDYGARIRRHAENNEADSFMSEEEAKLIAAHASPKVAAAIFISLYLGLRRSEITKLKAEDISDDQIVIHAANTKTLKTRILPIPDKVRPYLSLIPLGITPMGLGSSFDRARKRAGVLKRFHDLRHGCATALVNAKCDLYLVQRILGHTSSATTQRYAKLQTDSLKDALNKI